MYLTNLFYPLFLGRIFIISSLIFVSNRKHLLATLLTLELIILILFLMLYKFTLINSPIIWILIIYLVFAVCEGALGLSILVSIIRTHGNNYFQSFNSLIC